MDILQDVIYPVLQEIKEEEELDFQINEDLELYGENSLFDSLSIVRFIISVQERLEELLGHEVEIVDEETMSKSESPFISVKSLKKHIEEVIKNG